MTMQSGIRTNLVMGWETTYAGGPGDADAGIRLAYNSFNPTDQVTLTQPSTIQDDRNPVEPFEDGKDVTAELVLPVDTRQFGYVLKGTVGEPVTTSNGGGLYTHVFTVSNAGVPSFLLEEYLQDLSKYAHRYGMKVDSMKLDLGNSGELTATFSIVGSKMVASDASLFTTISNAGFYRLGVYDATVSEGGSAMNNAQMMGMEWSNNLDRDTFVIGGGGVRGSLPEGQVAFSGRIQGLFDGWSLIQKGIDGTETSLQWLLSRGTHSLKVEVQEARFEQNIPPVNGPQGRRYDLAWMGFTDDGSYGSVGKFTLINDIASYA